jgi:hypothetical protein
MRLLLLLACAAVAAAAERHQFRLERETEVVADLEMSAPGSDWGQTEREAALADLRLDGASCGNLMLYAGDRRFRYSVFLGRAAPGEHALEVERDGKYSAVGSGLMVHGVRFRQFRRGDPYYAVLANAPVLYARADTVGKFTDVPLLMYCERLEEEGQPLLQYTVIYSNEDGGTSTRALVARWGRTTDIDYALRVWVDTQGNAVRATYQGKDHKELAFGGTREGAHALLGVSTDNNMVSEEARSAIRYQLAPLVVDLTNASREQVMDQHPETYQVMAQELVREDKLRPFGTLEGENVSDPRNYLYFELKVANRNSGVVVRVRRRGEEVWWSSHLGRMDYAISRDGWVRTGVELPPGTTAAEIAEIGLECLVVRPERERWPHSGACVVEAVQKAFFLGPDYVPGPTVWSLPAAAMVIPTGVMRRFELPAEHAGER